MAFEVLEPRVLLSASGLGEPEAFEAGQIPAYINIDLPDKPADDVVSTCLRQAHADLEAGGDVGSLGFDLRANEAGELQVYVHVDAVNADIIGALEGAGLRVETSNARMKVVQGWLPHTNLDLAAAVESVCRITPPAYGITNAGSVTTKGDIDLNADDLRALFGGITGDGVKIGVISDGVDNWEDVADDPYNDLPDTITVDPYRPGWSNPLFAPYNEGTAMLEIIHDVAPDAELYFSGPETSTEMISSIDWLVNSCGVDVVVDDISWLDQPMFEDGTVADEAADAVADGVVYVSVAGNYAKTHCQADYDPYVGGSSHDFGFGNLLPVAVPVDGVIRAVLEWSDGWGTSGNDYDLYLYGRETGQQWEIADGGNARSERTQNGNDAPWEYISYKNDEGYDDLAFLFNKYSGSARELEFYVYGPAELYPAYVTPEDSIYGHAAVEEVITIGAIDTADLGLNDVEPFSSHGPSTIYTNFSTQTSTERDALDVCGIDGVQTKIGQLEYFSNPFFGTSAAAPHIAGIAALLLEIDPSLTPAEIENLICANAVDIGDAGYDDVSGYGRADALATVTAAATAVDLKATSDTGTSDTDDLTKLDNSAAGKELQFAVTGTVAGATVTIWAGEVEIGSATASGATTTVTTGGDYDLADTGHSITARQTEDDKLESPATSALTVTVDTAAPTVDIEDVSPDPRGTAVADSLDITFSETIDHNEFTMADLGLTRDGVTVSLSTADLTDSGNHVDWTLDDLDDLTDRVGEYELTLTASGSGITDLAGNLLAAPADDEWLMHTVLGTGGADTISLAWNDGTSRTHVVVGVTEYDFNPANLTVLYVEAGVGDDELTVDFSDGDPLPTGGLDLDGGAGTDTLEIVGSTSADTVACTTTQATVNGSDIDHTAVESLVLALDGGENAVEVVGGFGVEDLTILGGGGGSYTFEADDPDDTASLELTLQDAADVTFETSLRLETLTLSDTSVGTIEALADPYDTSRFIKTGSLSIAESGGTPTATLDLTNNNLIVDYEAGSSPFDDIERWIIAGYDGGAWDGTGITSSAAADDPGSLTALGVLDNDDPNPALGGKDDLEGEAVDATSVLVKYTYYGDATLDGQVDVDDLNLLEQTWALGPQPAGSAYRWGVGDFDFDEDVDIDDLNLLERSWALQGEPL